MEEILFNHTLPEKEEIYDCRFPDIPKNKPVHLRIKSVPTPYQVRIYEVRRWYGVGTEMTRTWYAAKSSFGAAIVDNHIETKTSKS